MRGTRRWLRRGLGRTAWLWERTIHALFTMDRRTTVLACTALFLLFTVVDVLTPPQLNLTFLYVFVILLVCWNAGTMAGIAFALAASAVQVANFYGSGVRLEPVYQFFILGNRVFTFLIVVALTIPLRQLHAREQRTSRTDFLTDVLNRMALYELLVVESARSKRTGNPLSVAYIDCDNFKAVNDRFGHEQGDELLRSVARTTKRALRATDAVARLGGDEFAILLPETGSETALQIVDRLRADLDRVMAANHWPVTFSIGLGVFRGPASSPEEIIHRCDTLMYGVKSRRKNGIGWEVVEADQPALAR